MGILHGDSTSTSSSGSGAPTICPAYPTPVSDAEPIVGSLTFTQLSHYVSGIAAAVGLLIIIILILLHAANLSNRAEQIRIIRIISIVPTFGLLSFGSTYLGVNAIDLTVWMHPCEAIGLASFFQLICVYLSPRDSNNGPSFEQVPEAVKLELNQNGGQYDPSYPINGAPMYRSIAPTKRQQLMAFQYVPVSILVAVFTDITNATGKYCFNANYVHFAHIWLQIVQSLSVFMAFITIMRFTGQSKKAIPNQHVMLKLFSFKGLVFLEIVQNLIFSFASADITPTAKFAYTDLVAALPAMILNVETVIFAFIFLFSYSHRPYSGNGRRTSNGFSAVFEAFNPVSVIRALLTKYH